MVSRTLREEGREGEIELPRACSYSAMSDAKADPNISTKRCAPHFFLNKAEQDNIDALREVQAGCATLSHEMRKKVEQIKKAASLRTRTSCAPPLFLPEWGFSIAIFLYRRSCEDAASNSCVCSAGEDWVREGCSCCLRRTPA